VGQPTRGVVQYTAGAREPKGVSWWTRAPATIYTARAAQGRASLSSGALARVEARPLVAGKGGSGGID